MNLWDALILAGVAALIVLAWLGLRRRGAKGCSGCCADCARSCRRREK